LPLLVNDADTGGPEFANAAAGRVEHEQREPICRGAEPGDSFDVLGGRRLRLLGLLTG
jgi:hypothetical protein